MGSEKQETQSITKNESSRMRKHEDCFAALRLVLAALLTGNDVPLPQILRLVDVIGMGMWPPDAYTYTCVYIYIYTHVCLYLYVHMSICTCIHMYTYTHCMYVHTHMHVSFSL